jgi:pimeloyl-ACP methyl ester carboxylesterase
MIWDFIYRGESIHLDDPTRKSVKSGSFIKLRDGCTHYEIEGIPTELPVVLVHGFSVPYFIWDPTFEALTSQGFSVLRYDLFGRGYSDRPRLKNNMDLFIRQLGDLLDGLKLSKINLIGLSMGGAIASAFTVQQPQRVHKLVLIDPIGVLPMPLNLLYKAAFLPGLSEMILGLVGTEKMVRNLAADFFDKKHIELFQDQFRLQTRIKGFKRSILSTLRNGMLNGFPNVYKQMGKIKKPIMLLWGRNDQTLPLEQSASLLKLLPEAEFRVIENCGHIPHYEKPDIVNPLLIRFLESK